MTFAKKTMPDIPNISKLPTGVNVSCVSVCQNWQPAQRVHRQLGFTPAPHNPPKDKVNR